MNTESRNDQERLTDLGPLVDSQLKFIFGPTLKMFIVSGFTYCKHCISELMKMLNKKYKVLQNTSFYCNQECLEFILCLVEKPATPKSIIVICHTPFCGTQVLTLRHFHAYAPPGGKSASNANIIALMWDDI